MCNGKRQELTFPKKALISSVMPASWTNCSDSNMAHLFLVNQAWCTERQRYLEFPMHPKWSKKVAKSTIIRTPAYQDLHVGTWLCLFTCRAIPCFDAFSSLLSLFTSTADTYRHVCTPSTIHWQHMTLRAWKLVCRFLGIVTYSFWASVPVRWG